MELFKHPPLRRSNGKFATPEQFKIDKVMKRNAELEYKCEMYERKLRVFEKQVLNREYLAK